MEVLEQIDLRLYPILVALMSILGRFLPVAIIAFDRPFPGRKPPTS